MKTGEHFIGLSEHFRATERWTREHPSCLFVCKFKVRECVEVYSPRLSTFIGFLWIVLLFKPRYEDAWKFRFPLLRDDHCSLNPVLDSFIDVSPNGARFGWQGSHNSVSFDVMTDFEGCPPCEFSHYIPRAMFRMNCLRAAPHPTKSRL
jgi:hypothetical protein